MVSPAHFLLAGRNFCSARPRPASSPPPSIERYPAPTIEQQFAGVGALFSCQAYVEVLRSLVKDRSLGRPIWDSHFPSRTIFAFSFLVYVSDIVDALQFAFPAVDAWIHCRHDRFFYAATLAPCLVFGDLLGGSVFESQGRVFVALLLRSFMPGFTAFLAGLFDVCVVSLARTFALLCELCFSTFRQNILFLAPHHFTPLLKNSAIAS